MEKQRYIRASELKLSRLYYYKMIKVNLESLRKILSLGKTAEDHPVTPQKQFCLE